MIDTLLIIGFWLIYIVINTVVSAMSKEPLFEVFVHSVLFIIFVGLRWLLQGYLNEQYAMRYHLHRSDISLVGGLTSPSLFETIAGIVIMGIVLFGFVVTTYGPILTDTVHVSPSGVITYALTVIATIGILLFAGPDSVSRMSLETESTRIVNEQTFQPGQDDIMFEMQSEKDGPWEPVTQPHTVEELRKADFRAIRGSNTNELTSWNTTIQPKDITVTDAETFTQWVMENKIPVRVVKITRQRVVERQVHPRYPRIYKDQEYNATIITYEFVNTDTYAKYKGSKSLDNLVNPK